MDMRLCAFNSIPAMDRSLPQYPCRENYSRQGDFFSIFVDTTVPSALPTKDNITLKKWGSSALAKKRNGIASD